MTDLGGKAMVVWLNILSNSSLCANGTVLCEL